MVTVFRQIHNFNQPQTTFIPCFISESERHGVLFTTDQILTQGLPTWIGSALGSSVSLATVCLPLLDTSNYSETFSSSEQLLQGHFPTKHRQPTWANYKLHLLKGATDSSKTRDPLDVQQAKTLHAGSNY